MYTDISKHMTINKHKNKTVNANEFHAWNVTQRTVWWRRNKETEV